MMAWYFLLFKSNAVEKGGVTVLFMQYRFYRSGILISMEIMTLYKYDIF